MIISGVLLAYHLDNGRVAAFVLQPDDGTISLFYVERPSIWHAGFLPYAVMGRRYEVVATKFCGENSYSAWGVREPGGKFPTLNISLKNLQGYHPALIALLEREMGPITKRTPGEERIMKSDDFS